MEKIELVITLPKEYYNLILDNGFFDTPSFDAIRKGRILPKGHGNLKDVSKINYQQGCFIDKQGNPIPIIHKIATIEMIRDWLPTIIEADKEGAEE